MDPTAWSLTESDPHRSRRLAIGYGTGILVCTALFSLGFAVRAEVLPPEEEETVLEVSLATAPETPRPEAPPPSPVAAPQNTPPAPPRPRPLAVPTAIPTEAPREADPGAALGAPGGDPYSQSGPGGAPGGTGIAAAAAPAPPPPPPPPPPKPKAAGPVQLPENASPPIALSNPMPAYPEAARKAGVEATVVVKFVVSETGEVTSVSIVRGHPLFDASVLSTMRAWRYKPAMADGRPIAVFRVFKFPFKIKS